MQIRKYLAAATCIVSIFSSGCFERKEEITIDENGDIIIQTLFGILTFCIPGSLLLFFCWLTL